MSCPDGLGRVMSGQAGLSRVRAGSFLLSVHWRLASRKRFLPVYIGYWAAYTLARAVHLNLIPWQQDSSPDDCGSLSTMPFRISVQWHYITVFDVIAWILGKVRD